MKFPNFKKKIKFIVYEFFFIFHLFLYKFLNIKIFINNLIKFSINNKKNVFLNFFINKKDFNLDESICAEKVFRYFLHKENFINRDLKYNKKDFENLIYFNKKLLLDFPNDPVLNFRLSRNYMIGGNRFKSRKYYNHLLKSQRVNKINKSETGLLFFVSMPRSGTGYVSKSLEKGLDLLNLNNFYDFRDSWFPDHSIFPFPEYLSNENLFDMRNGIVTSHATATELNLWSIDHITDRLIINLRDPRQSIISWAPYMNYLRSTGNYGALIEYQIPDGYFFLSLNDQIQWQIDNYFLKVNIDWINNWIIANDSKDFLSEILFMNYELLSDNPNKYFNKILDFYSIPYKNFSYPQKPAFQHSTHMRKGQKDEWKEILNSNQKKQINDHITDKMFNIFNWSRE